VLHDQWIVFGVLTVTLGLFVWNRLRFDIVAMLALLAVAVAGLVPIDQLFSGFGHPAVITVAAVLVISQGLVNGGVVDAVARLLGKVGHNAVLQVITLTAVVALCSAFINNVGALALLMPVAIWMSRKSGRSPSLLLMPLAFGSLLGGTITLIGTPPNIIIASYREAGSFGLVDFAPVGLAITVAGILFIGLVGWRLTPKRDDPASGDKLFSVGDYVTELRVPEGSDYAGSTLHNLLTSGEDDKSVVVLALIRGESTSPAPSTFKVLREGDVLLVEADTESLQEFVDNTKLVLANVVDEDESENDGDEPVRKGRSREDKEDDIATGDVRLTEAVITPSSRLIGRTTNRLNLRERYGLNVVAVARQGHRLKQRLADIRFRSGDILLIQGYENTLTPIGHQSNALVMEPGGYRFGDYWRLGLPLSIVVTVVAVPAIMWMWA